MKRVLRRILHAELRLPGLLRVIVRWIYRGGVLLREVFDGLYAMAVVKPVMQSIASGGQRLRIERIPYIRGNGRIEIGDDVYISGLLGVSFLKRDDNHGAASLRATGGPKGRSEAATHGKHEKGEGQVPTLRIGDRSFVGHQCSFALSKSIEIGSDCLIANGTKIQDNDGHPLDAEARRNHERVAVSGIRSVRVGDNVWIAPRCTILKGVTIGDNAVVGAGSVVTKDVPANTVVAGNPARVIRELVTTESTESTEK